ncbi:putative inorganic phosphate cotransporter [Chionoecetes opilio]|uniref:Sialin n=1 Tax=Chionoecetes opilio TaxID=41210 RepID=A0A8J4YA35_CHIOP|nr:putative inorganic phosphate cotransporter [Chionoecetes opilio]
MSAVRDKPPTAQEVLRRMGSQEEKEVLVDSRLVKDGGVFGARHVLGAMGFLGFANVYAMRVNLSVAVVAMVNSSAIPHTNTSAPDSCPDNGFNASTGDVQEGEFAWDENMQALILGSFFWGYIITNPLGGRLGEVIGGKWVLGVGVLVTSLLTLITPIVARTSTTLLIATRVVMGLGEGVTFPAMNSLMARWVPPLERSRMSSLVYAGAQFGTVVSLPICGLLCQGGTIWHGGFAPHLRSAVSGVFLGGWPAVFYVFGVLGILWFVAWMVLIHNDPSSHPRIHPRERLFIQQSLHHGDVPTKALPVPYMSIINSMPFWAVFVAHIAQNWGFYTLLTELPTFMKNILHFNIANNSFMSALPYLCMWVFSLLAGLLADTLRSRGHLSTTNTRRLFNSIGIYGPMVCIVLVGYAGCNRGLAILLLCLGVGLNGAVYSGYMNSHIDIAPNFAGTLMGITNCAATVPGFLAPMVVGALVDGKETVGQWKLVFWIAAIVYLVGNTFYVIFVSGEEQPWNNLPGSSNSGSSVQASSSGQVASQYRTFSNPEEAEGGAGNTVSRPRKVPEIF